MKFQIGDKVVINHSNDDGVVVDFINDKMVMVEVRGVQFPVYLDQIDFPYFRDFTKNKKIFEQKPAKVINENLKREKINKAEKVENGVWLYFSPIFDTDEFGDEYVEKLKIQLINNTHYAFNFEYELKLLGNAEFELKNNIQPFENFHIHDVAYENMNDSPSFDFVFSLVQENPKMADHFEAHIKIKTKQLFNKIEELKKNNLPHFSHILFENYPVKPKEEVKDTFSLDALRNKGFKVYDAKDARKHLAPPRSVIDLHIEKLTDRWKHLSNFEILSIQLKEFEKYFDLSVSHYQPSLIVIHGVGEGILRDEIHNLLKYKKEVKSFVNQYHPNYGYGATEIFFKY